MDTIAAPDDTYALDAGLAYREVEGEALMVSVDRGLHRVAAPSGLAILRALRERPRRRAELVGLLTARFDGRPEEIVADLDAFLDQLLRKGIARRAADVGGAP